MRIITCLVIFVNTSDLLGKMLYYVHIMKLNYQNSCLISADEINKTGTKLTDYIQHLKQVLASKNYVAPESSMNLPFDEKILQQVKKLVSDKVTSKLKYIIDIGIGGSSLGTKAVYDALYGYFDLIEPNRFPKIIFVDTTDPEFLEKTVKFLANITDPQEILINLISKSGTNTEPVVNGQLILDRLKLIDPNLARLVITTDEGSKMWTLAEQKNISKLGMPKQVGGRYSVFSAVGLFPLMACGISIDQLIAGARLAVQQCSNEITQQNPAVISAIILYLQSQKGKNINDNFIFHPELESLGKWYRQLMAESTGKDNAAVLTPTVSIGSTDLHSMVQLYLGGPKDKITTFIYTNKSTSISLPQTSILYDLVPGTSGKSVKEIMNAIFEGTKIAYQKKELPFIEVILDDISEKSLGEFLQFKMIEMMYLGKLLNINTFDQPNVEDYKAETRSILNS